MDFPDFNVVSLTNFGGLLCIVAYTVIKGDKSNLGDAASSFLGGTGVVGGGYLCLISLNKFACESPGLEEHRTYVFLGGAAVLRISAAGLRANLKRCSDDVRVAR